MNNKEIRKIFDCEVCAGTGDKHYAGQIVGECDNCKGKKGFYDIDAIQNLTRTDERNKVIEECRLTQFKNPKTDFGDGWNAAIADVIAKLQLKEQK